jgi:ketosteroid isomerase-like protein
VHPAWVVAKLKRLDDLMGRDPRRAKIEILKHLDGDLEIAPLLSSPGERRAEITGRAKSDSLLSDQEAIRLQVLRGLATTKARGNYRLTTPTTLWQDRPTTTGTQSALYRRRTRTMSEHEIIAADDRRFQAMVKQDWAALSSALADDLVYVHSSARVESKREHVSNLQAGKPNYRGASPRDRKVRMRGDVGIVNGVSEMHVENAGKDQHFTIRYLAVYAKIADRWQMTAWQSTKVPDA